MSTEVEPQSATAPITMPLLKILPLGLASGVLLYLCHFPVGWGFLGWLALVPLLFLVRVPASRWRLFLAAWLAGLTFYFPVIAWMRVADPDEGRMVYTWLMLAAYCSFYMPLAIGLTRYLDRRTAIPLVISVPAVWTALDYARAHLLTGFAWYFLGHTQHDVLPMIQIADLTGAYGVTFVVAAVNAWLFELLWSRPGIRRIFQAGESPCYCLGWQSGGVLLLLASVLGYGVWRLGQDDFAVGPRVALIQSSLDQRIRNDSASELSADTMKRHNVALTNWAAARQPDLIVWPETSWPDSWVEVSPDLPLADVPAIWRENAKGSQELAVAIGKQWNAPLLLGLNSQYLFADGRGRRRNSAVLIQPDGSVAGQYHKIHRVPFGEYVPFRDWLPWMNSFAPYEFDYSIIPGDTFTRLPSRDYRFGVIICYEDTDPLLARQYVADDPVDFLVNISNDGWFDGTSEHDEHLAICRFRAVECRRAVVRAVNMGISAIIDGNGRVREPDLCVLDQENRQASGDVPVSRWHEFKKKPGVLIAAVPIDDRPSLYAQWGDWFPIGCWVLVGVAFTGGAWRPRKQS